MNLYFLVEGKTERKLYPAWLSVLLPNFQRVNIAAQATQQTYYLISSNGYPGLLDVTLPDAIDDILDVNRYDYLVIVLDADEVSVSERRQEVEKRLASYTLGRCRPHIVVQNCCLESWLLGNRTVFSRQPANPDLRDCVTFYDVYNDDPELMLKPTPFTGSIAAYHFKYLQLMLKARRIQYNKKDPRDTAEPYYLQQLQERVAQTPTHLHTLQSFLAFCRQVEQENGLSSW